MKKTRLPQLKQKDDGWYIPACPPHYEESVGPYELKYEAEEARTGMTRTINSPLWRDMILDEEEEEEEEERIWEELRQAKLAKERANGTSGQTDEPSSRGDKGKSKGFGLC